METMTIKENADLRADSGKLVLFKNEIKFGQIMLQDSIVIDILSIINRIDEISDMSIYITKEFINQRNQYESNYITEVKVYDLLVVISYTTDEESKNEFLNLQFFQDDITTFLISISVSQVKQNLMYISIPENFSTYYELEKLLLDTQRK